jgi:hypothetical protein
MNRQRAELERECERLRRQYTWLMAMLVGVYLLLLLGILHHFLK